MTVVSFSDTLGFCRILRLQGVVVGAGRLLSIFTSKVHVKTMRAVYVFDQAIILIVSIPMLLRRSTQRYGVAASLRCRLRICSKSLISYASRYTLFL